MVRISLIASSATATAATKTTTTWSAVFSAWSGFVNFDGSTFQVFFIQTRNSSCAFVFVRHLYKTKTTGSASFSICDDFCSFHFTKSGKGFA